MRYMDCRTAFSQKIARDAEQWTKDFLERWKKRLDADGSKYSLTGHFSFDFIVDNDGTLFPIECNPRIHTAIVLLSSLDAETIVESYLREAVDGHLSPSLLNQDRYSWTFHAIPLALATLVLPRFLQSRLHPLLTSGVGTNPLAPQIPPITVSPPINVPFSVVVMDYLTGLEKDPLLDIEDPMPFAAQNIQWIWLLARLVLIQRKGWSRVNISTSRLFSC